MITGYALATLSALFNTTAATCLFFGYRAIRKKDRARHRRFMLSAFFASCAFLTAYLTRIVMYGDTRFSGVGAMRVFYLALLASHVLLALATAPLVLTTLGFGLRGSFERHKRIARYTLPIWAYVSVTGVIVYLLLYHFQP